MSDLKSGRFLRFEDRAVALGGLKRRKRPCRSAEKDRREAEEPNRRLANIAARLKERPKVTIEYFVSGDLKFGGAYVTVTGWVRHVSLPERSMVMEDGTVVNLEDVVATVGEGDRFEV